MKKTLIEQLRDEVSGTPAPSGWYTIGQLMEKLGTKRSVMENFVKRKNWESRRFRTVANDGRTLNVKHYNVGTL